MARSQLVAFMVFMSSLSFSQINHLDSIKSIQHFDSKKYNHLKVVETIYSETLLVNENANAIVKNFDKIWCEIWNDNFIRVKENGKYGIFSLESLSFVIEPEYETIFLCRNWDGLVENCLIARTSEKNSGLLNYNGDTLFQFANHHIEMHGINLKRGIIKIQENDQGYLVNLKGEKICSKPYELFRNIIGEYCFVSNNSKEGIIDLDCNEIIPPIYDHVSYLISGYRLVKLNGKYGLISEQGKIKLSPIFASIIREHDNKIPSNLTGYKFTYYDYTFVTNADLKCIKNCNKKILRKILPN